MKVEHRIIALLILIIALLVLYLLYNVSKYYSLFYKHTNALNALYTVPHDNNPQLKAVKDKHMNGQSRGKCTPHCSWGVCDCF